MRVMGIDPGLQATGYGIVEDGDQGYRAVGWGTIKTVSSKSLSSRLAVIYHGLQEAIGKYYPDEVAVEDLFFANNVKSAIRLGEARGVTILAASNLNLKVTEYTPLEVKQAVVGYGRATKEQVKSMVVVLLAIVEDVVEDHSADALALGICHLNTMVLRHKLPSIT